MSERERFDDKYWNLAQASAWVEYREKRLVQDLGSADRNAYMAIGRYPTMWPAGRKRHGSVEELRRVLELGQITASGYRHDTLGHPEEIPSAEWADLQIRPPFVYFSGQPNNQLWTAVRLRSADVKKHWRSATEVSGRSKHDWDAIRPIYKEILALHPAMSQNELIVEVQGSYEERFKKGAPSRSAIQRNIKTWT